MKRTWIFLLILSSLTAHHLCFAFGDMKLRDADIGKGFIPEKGFVPDADTAVKIAMAVLMPIYGEQVILSERPFTTSLSNDVWTVTGSACKAWGLDVDRLLWVRAKSTGDALWTTEQILKNGSCGAVILWQANVRPESLRRLNLAAQSTDTWFWFIRPLVSASDASPAPLRIALRPAKAGISLEIIKRRGPQADSPFFLSLADMPAGKHPVGPKDETVIVHTPAPVAARSDTPVLV